MDSLSLELLAALEALVAEVEDKDNPRDEGCSEHCDQMIVARAVIVKAGNEIRKITDMPHPREPLGVKILNG